MDTIINNGTSKFIKQSYLANGCGVKIVAGYLGDGFEFI